MCLPRVIDRPMPKKKHAELAPSSCGRRGPAAARASGPVSATARRSTCWPLTSARRIVMQLEILAGPNLQEDIGGLGALRFANVDQHHRAVLAAARQELALLHERVFGEVPRMALGRVAAPVDDEIGPVLHFAERTRDFATQLGGDLGGTVSQAMCGCRSRRPISSASDDAFALRLAGDVAHAVDQRHVGGVQRSSAAASIASSSVASRPSISASG